MDGHQTSGIWPPSLESMGAKRDPRSRRWGVLLRERMTFSWFYVPLIAHAMRHGHRHPAFPAAHPRCAKWIAAIVIAITERERPNLRFEDVVTEEGGAYVRPDFQVAVQRHLEGLEMYTELNSMNLYAEETAQAACTAANAADANRFHGPGLVGAVSASLGSLGADPSGDGPFGAGPSGASPSNAGTSGSRPTHSGARVTRQSPRRPGGGTTTPALPPAGRPPDGAGLAPHDRQPAASPTAGDEDANPLLLQPPEGKDLPWPRLLDPTLHRPFVITAWRLAHGQLGCNAFLHYVQRKVPAITSPCSNLCGSPACAELGRIETLTHAFMECPDMAPAIDWLCQAWAALTGQAAPPRSAAVLLGDDLRAWTVDSPAEEPRLLALWTRLRVAAIGSIWQARCARDQGRLRDISPARLAILLAAKRLRGAIERDWLRVSEDIRTLDNGFFCADWWRGVDPQLSMEKFSSSWAFGSIFCTVTEGDEDAEPPLPASIAIHVGEDQPIPFPA